MSLLIMSRISLVLLLSFFNLINFIQGQLCTINYLPASQIIDMDESIQPDELVANLSIIGTASQISLRLVYNSSEVKTNGSNYFYLDFKSLYLRSILDYDWWNSNNYPNPFRLIIQCIILSNQSIVDIDFQLNLIDVNDNPPRFSQDRYLINITETTPINTVVPTTIVASDIDSAPYRVFTYSLLNDSSPYISYFQLVSSSIPNLLLVRSLNYNSMGPQFNLTIVARDSNNASLFSQAVISISIIDVDNLNPKFNAESYNLNISIDTLVNTRVTPNEGSIVAFDQDLGINASIIYSILSSSIYFSMDSATGLLFLRSVFNTTAQFDLLIRAEQSDNRNRSATVILHVNVFELNNYSPSFLNLPYVLIGYSTNDPATIPVLNGSINDNDTTPRLVYASRCNSSQLNLDIRKISLRQFQIQPVLSQSLPLCDPCICQLNVSDGKFAANTDLSVFLYRSASFSINSSLFSVEYSAAVGTINVSSISVMTNQILMDSRCSVQYSIDVASRLLFSITQAGLLTWSNTANIPSQGAYQVEISVQQNCSSQIQKIVTPIFVTFRNIPTTTGLVTSPNSSNTDNTILYAVIASVGAFILVVIAILFIVLYYHIQRAKHRVPPFFKNRKRSPAQGLAFLRSKRSLSPKPPYTLDVRDDDSSNSTSSDQTVSSPIENRLLSGRYKVTEPPPAMNTTIEELLSSYDNRSTSSSSSSNSSDVADRTGSSIKNLGSLRPINHDHHSHLDTIDEDLQWFSKSPRVLHPSSTSGSVSDVGLSASNLLQPHRSMKKPSNNRNINEHLTVFV